MTTSTELTCKEFVEIVTEYLEAGMAPREKARFESHLLACKGCRTYLEQMRHTIRALGQLSESHLSPEAQYVLLNAFRNWKRQ